MAGSIALCLLVAVGCVLASSVMPDVDDTAPERKWGKTIRQFEDWDRKNSWPEDAVLFVGSSSIRMWPTRESFEGLKVINRGFGGSQISEVNHFVERIVLKYRPRLIVFYAGDNDVAVGKNAKRVFADYRKFVKIVREELPQTGIIYIGIKPSWSRWGLWPIMAEANSMIRDMCGEDSRLIYFDSATPLLNEGGKPDGKLFLGDNLHLNKEGYKKWTKLLRPLIDKAVKGNGGRKRK